MSLPALSKTQKRRLENLGVEVLYLFGSRAQGKAGPLSDYDYAVLHTEKGHTRGDALYHQLYDILCDISPRDLKTDVIDIVFLKDIGLELCFHVVRYGVILYEKNPKIRLDFENRISLLYCDFRPLLDQFDRSILKAI